MADWTARTIRHEMLRFGALPERVQPVTDFVGTDELGETYRQNGTSYLYYPIPNATRASGRVPIVRDSDGAEFLVGMGMIGPPLPEAVIIYHPTEIGGNRYWIGNPDVAFPGVVSAMEFRYEGSFIADAGSCTADNRHEMANTPRWFGINQTIWKDPAYSLVTEGYMHRPFVPGVNGGEFYFPDHDYRLTPKGWKLHTEWSKKGLV